MKRLILGVFCLSLVLGAAVGASVGAAADHDGKIVKMEGLSTLYYVMDGKRYVFPNEKAYSSWFTGFDSVATLSPEEMYALPLAGNVRYRPGVMMVKITTDPKVYAVGPNGQLRWVKTEQIAKRLYGDNWNLLVDDIPDSFFTNYSVGAPIESDSDYDADATIAANDTIEKSHGLALGHAKQATRATTGKCRAVPAVPATPGKKGNPATPATPAIPARECRAGSNDVTPADKTAPAIADVASFPASSTALITWATDELSDSAVTFGTSSPLLSSYNLTLSDASSTLMHSLKLTGLATSTKYYYLVKSKDAGNNLGTSTEYGFTTLAE